MVFISKKNYIMFRPIAAIFRFWQISADKKKPPPINSEE